MHLSIYIQIRIMYNLILSWLHVHVHVCMSKCVSSLTTYEVTIVNYKWHLIPSKSDFAQSSAVVKLKAWAQK